MKIGNVTPLAPIAPAAPVAAVMAPGAAAADVAPFASEMLQAAQAAMGELPDMDMARVRALRDALARGEIPFNPAKLAGLIERYHHGKGGER